MNKDNKNKLCLIVMRKPIFDKFSKYCKITKRSKLDQLEIIIEDFFKDKYIPEKSE